MNKGLPSLLDAIFGKNDLALVSLDEMYEVISEFPSFNAGHFLLSKKLKENNDPAFEKQSMRTALYFNNALWLQTLLDEGNKVRIENSGKSVETYTEDHINGQDINNIESQAAHEILREEHIAEHPENEIIEPDEATDTIKSFSESVSRTVTSFDELLSKYKIEPEHLEEEISKEIKVENVEENTNLFSGDEPIHIQEEEKVRDFSDHPAAYQEEIITFVSENEIAPPAEVAAPDDPLKDRHQEPAETKHEVLNEYGILEEAVVKPTDPDLDFEAFDRPIDPVETVSEFENESIQAEEIQAPEEIPFESDNRVPSEIQTPDEIQFESDIQVLSEVQAPEEIQVQSEIPVLDETPEKTDVHEFESFDRPLEKNNREQADYDYSRYEEIHHTDKTPSAAPFHPGHQEDMKSQLPDENEHKQEAQSKVPVFDPKREESIVFAPYHMIDYFASQGIKLVLEDNPADHFGQQLKSFTDWLKVMKKLPPNQQTVKTDEKEADRIRHFAAHSIEDRDVLTESMAEVLAKQGMYENAIALYQKLSLIYPPKSAYFASRIEQLKASLP